MPNYIDSAYGLAVPQAWPTNGHTRDDMDGYTRVGLTERLAELELAAEDAGWLREAAWNDRDFSRDGLKRILRLSRLSYLKNPLIQRGVNVQAVYVWGQGVDIRAADDAINEVVQAFLADKQNQSELTSHEARVSKEKELQVTGNLFFCFFTRPASGKVRIRSIPVDEILAVITNPDDQMEPWYYKRQYVRAELDTINGATRDSVEIAYYPAWRYHPDVKPPTIGNAVVYWDVPVYHVKVGGLRDMRFGVPETYAALDWARAVKADLEDYATTKRALSRFAWNMTTKGGAKGVAAAKTKMGTTLGNSDPYTETNPPPLTGSMFISGEGTQLQPMRTSGAQPSTDDGRRLWLMVASAMGLPETFFGEASVGSHATAKTLDRPTELKMRDRQVLWTDIFKDILEYVIDQEATAPGGTLQGTVEYDADGERYVDLGVDADGNERDRQVEVNFPPMLERDALQRVGAVVQAITLGGYPSAGTFDKRTATQLLLQALSEDDIDQTLDRLAPDDGVPLLPPVLPTAAEPPKVNAPAHPQIAKPAVNPPDDTGAEKDVQEAARAVRESRGHTGDLNDAMVDAVRELRAAIRPIARRELRERAVIVAKPVTTQVTKLVERNADGQIVSVTERHEPIAEETT